jgi:hypothetical protein
MFQNTIYSMIETPGIGCPESYVRGQTVVLITKGGGGPVDASTLRNDVLCVTNGADPGSYLSWSTKGEEKKEETMTLALNEARAAEEKL